jgi:energy-coupling factor transporter transmembrane protein EcfT
MTLIMSILLTDLKPFDATLAGLPTVGRFLLLIGSGAIFVLITDPWEIPSSLAKIRVPHRYCIVFLVGLRMLAILRKKIRRIAETQMARGAVFSFAPRYWLKSLTSISALITPILISAFTLSVSFADSLIARGFDPDAKVTPPPWNLTLWDFILFSLALGIFICLFII